MHIAANDLLWLLVPLDSFMMRVLFAGLGDSHQIQLMPDPTAGLSFSMEFATTQGQAFYPDQNLNTQAIQDDYMNDMNKIAQTFQVGPAF